MKLSTVLIALFAACTGALPTEQEGSPGELVERAVSVQKLPPRKTSCLCGIPGDRQKSKSYISRDINAAALEGVKHLNAGTTAKGTRARGKYPHVFLNSPENFVFPNCGTIPAGFDLYEFPILPGRQLFTNASPGPKADRVIFMTDAQGQQAVTYCGLVSHNPSSASKTLPHGGFDKCTC